MLAKVLLGLLTLSLIIGSAIAVMIYATGVVEISIKEKDGTNLYLPVPMLFLGSTLYFLPREKVALIQSHLGEDGKHWVRVMQALAECPDSTFVEVKNKTENVYIAKEGRDFILQVDSPEKNVRIEFPLDSTTRAVAYLVR